MSELNRYLSAIRGFEKTEILVVGDLILDEYVEGQVKRISPEAPVQVVSVDRSFSRLGGAANVAHLTATLGARTRIAGAVGEDEAANTLLGLLDQARIDRSPVVRCKDRPTTRKLRVLAQHQQLIRLDWELSRPVLSEVVDACERACEHVGEAGAIVVSDYGKGVVSRASAERWIATARRKGVPLLVDPKSRDFRIYSGATVLTPNLRELEEAVGRHLSDASDGELTDLARALIADCQLEAMVVTLGARGMLVVPRQGESCRIAATAREVFDVTGAGDAAIALIALCLAEHVPLTDAASLANAAAGIVVGKIGTAVVEPLDLILAIRAGEGADGASPGGKVLGRADLSSTVQALQAAKKKVVFTNGCFDLLHAGHLASLRAAARLGDALIVGINSDASTRRLKGEGRPLVSEEDRAELVAALDCVTAVVLFDEDTPLQLIEELLPDVLVKGADYQLDRVVGRDVVEKHGGRVELIPLVEGLSTSKLVEKIRADKSAKQS